MTPDSSPSEKSVDPDAHLDIDEPSVKSQRTFPSTHQYAVHSHVNDALLRAVAVNCGIPSDLCDDFVEQVLPTMVPSPTDTDRHVMAFHLHRNSVFRHNGEIPFFNTPVDALKPSDDADDASNALKYRFVTTAIVTSLVYAHFARRYRQANGTTMPGAYIQQIVSTIVPPEAGALPTFDLGILDEHNWSSVDISQAYADSSCPQRLRTTYLV
jgi:hypothetical protein